MRNKRSTAAMIVVALTSLLSLSNADDTGTDSNSSRMTMRVTGLESLASANDKFPTEITIASLSQTLNITKINPKTAEVSRSPLFIDALTIVKNMDALSPLLMKASELSHQIKEVLIIATTPGLQIEYRLKNASIRSITPSLYMDASNTNNQESVTLTAETIVVSVTKGKTHSSVELKRKSDDE